MNHLDAAREYHAAGLKVIPFYRRADGSVTFPADYAKYRLEQSGGDIETLFSAESAGIALLCTEGLEAFDIDVKHDPAGNITSQFLENLKTSMAGREAFSRCVVQRTKSNGWHFIYRTEKPGGNQKVTYRADSKEAVIETRGEGGLLFIAPTPGYEVKMGSFSNIGWLASQERDIFFRCAQELNERPDADPPAPVRLASPATAKLEGQSPGDAYNARHSVQELAERYGWRVVSRAGGNVRLNKPGASNSRDIHASIVRTKTGEDRFYPFTTATAYDPEKCYSPFGMYAVEEHRGDFSAAASALALQGYGSRLAPHAPAGQAVEQAKEGLPSLLENVISTRFDYTAEIKEEDTVFFHYSNSGKRYSVGGFGQIGVLIGHEKSGKSFVLGCIASASLSGESTLNFQLDRRGRKIVWFDTEQSLFFYQWTQKRIHDMAGKRQNLPYYQAYHLRKLTPVERIAVIEHLLYQEKPGIVVIDGIVDLVANYNDLPEVQSVVNRLMRWTDELNALLISVLHVNKGDGKIRGHIGTEIKNKCDFAINVAKTGDNEYRVSNPTARHASFPSFEFSRGEDGLPIYDDNSPVEGAFPVRRKAAQEEPPPPAPANIPASSRPGKDEEIPF